MIKIAESKDYTNYGVLGIVAIVAIVAIIAFMNQGNIESVTGSFLFSKKVSYDKGNCVSSSDTRPCYQLKGFGDNNALNPTAGEKIFNACIKDNKNSYSGEYRAQTSYCIQKSLGIKLDYVLPYEETYYEKYKFCSQRDKFAIIKFEGICVPPDTHQVYQNLIVAGMLPVSGPIGTQVDISGFGFTDHNYVIMNNVITGPIWIPTPFSAPDAAHITFNIPSQAVVNFCPPKDLFPNVVCSSSPPENVTILPGQYHIAIFNQEGVAWASWGSYLDNIAPFTDIFTVT